MMDTSDLNHLTTDQLAKRFHELDKAVKHALLKQLSCLNTELSVRKEQIALLERQKAEIELDLSEFDS